MNRFIPICLLLFACTIGAAANVAPVVDMQMPDQAIYQNANATLELQGAFRDPDTKAVRFVTPIGNFDVALYSQAKPITATNFLRYVNEDRYFKTDPTTGHLASSFVHRSVPGFIVQGGGFIGTVNSADPTRALPISVLTFPPIQNEPGISNVRGTIAMAKLANDPNSATSQWFINLADNSANLDNQNGGFTVFGRVVGNGMAVVDQIAAIPTYNAVFILGNGAFSNLPLRNYDSTQPIRVPNLVSVTDLFEIPPFTFAVSSSDPTVASVTVKPNNTQITVGAHQLGTATITITATDYDGAMISQHFDVTVVASPGRLGNISTRLQVRPDPNALIGGFILSGSTPKRLLVRAIGPSLASHGVANPLSDPTLELHDSSTTLSSDDDWTDNANRQAIIDTTIAPTATAEAAILATLPSNNAGYTAIMRGVNNSSGVGLVETYDLGWGPGSDIANISTRGFVQTGENVMIGGFILTGSSATNVIIRGIGPSLSTQGVTNPLADPALELHNAQGAIIAQNDDWQNASNAADIQATGIAPTNPHEAAILTTQPPGSYTAIVSGMGAAPTGVALVEVYTLP